MALTDVSDEAQAGELEAWYTGQHFEDMVGTALYVRASLYRAVTPDTPRFLALYESNLEMRHVLARTPQETEGMRAAGRIHPAAGPRHFLFMEALEPGFFTFEAAGPKSLTGLLLMASNPKTPGTDDAFNDWYDNVHMTDIAATKLHRYAHRYRTINAGDDNVRYANIYETTLPDVERGLNGLGAFRQGWIDNGTYYDDREFKLRGAYALVGTYPALESSTAAARAAEGPAI